MFEDTYIAVIRDTDRAEGEGDYRHTYDDLVLYCRDGVYGWWERHALVSYDTTPGDHDYSKSLQLRKYRPMLAAITAPENFHAPVASDDPRVRQAAHQYLAAHKDEEELRWDGDFTRRIAGVLEGALNDLYFAKATIEIHADESKTGAAVTITIPTSIEDVDDEYLPEP